MIASSICELMTIRLPLRSCSASYASAWLIHRGKLAKKSRAKRRMVPMKGQTEKHSCKPSRTFLLQVLLTRSDLRSTGGQTLTSPASQVSL